MSKRGIEDKVLGNEHLAVIDKISPVGVFRLDKLGNCIYTNQRWCAISGYSIDNSLGNGWLRAVHPDDLDDITEWWSENTIFHQNTAKELRLLTPENQLKWVVIRLAPERDSNKNITGFIGSITDITERKRAGQSLKESEELNRTLVENSPNAILIQLADTTIVFANKKTLEMIGANDEHQIIGRSTREFIFSEDRPELDARLQKIIQTNETGPPYEFGIKRLDGTKIIGESVAVPFKWKGEQAILLVIHDVTAAKESLKRLEISEQNLKQFITDAPVAVAMFNTDMNYVGCSLRWIVDWWKKPEKVTPEYFIGKNHYALFPDVTEYWKKVHKRALMGAYEANEEDCFVGEDGQTHWLRWEARPWHQSDGSVGGIIIYTEFITERKKAENELKILADKLMKSNKELQQFAYITSHNLRAPMVNLDTLLGLYEPDNAYDNDQKEIYAKIVSSVDQLKSSLNDLIKLVEVRESHETIKKEVRFEDSLKQVLRALHTQIITEEAHIKHDFSQARSVHFESNVMESILQNLLTNAIKYRRPEPLKITLKTQDFRDYVVLTVKDNGIGMDLEKVGNKLFGMYQRFHNTGEGKGLGLYIIKSQLESLGGRIEVKSKPGEGTTFIIYFKKY